MDDDDDVTLDQLRMIYTRYRHRRPYDPTVLSEKMNGKKGKMRRKKRKK